MSAQVAQERSLAGRGLLLKACIFATGMSGIVAEYAISTLAGYLLGNEVVQFALVVSTMLFAMGLGSRLSRRGRRCGLGPSVATWTCCGGERPTPR